MDCLASRCGRRFGTPTCPIPATRHTSHDHYPGSTSSLSSHLSQRTSERSGVTAFVTVLQELIDLHHRFRAHLEATVPSSSLLILEVGSWFGPQNLSTASHVLRQPLLEFLAVKNPVLASSDFPSYQMAHLRLARTILDLIAATLPLWLCLSVWLLPKVAVMLCCCCIRCTPRLNVARWIWRWKHPKSKMR